MLGEKGHLTRHSWHSGAVVWFYLLLVGPQITTEAALAVTERSLQGDFSRHFRDTSATFTRGSVALDEEGRSEQLRYVSKLPQEVDPLSHVTGNTAAFDWTAREATPGGELQGQLIPLLADGGDGCTGWHVRNSKEADCKGCSHFDFPVTN